MTVNAVAKELGKNVLLVDFGSLTGKKEGADIDADLKGLFREAQMSNCVLFFDECEVVFRNRYVYYGLLSGDVRICDDVYTILLRRYNS